jgi:hypothetical protein
MTGNAEEQELKDRLSLIETMIAEGRRTTESWGWVFVLWGLAYYVAIVWQTFSNNYLAWPVTMTAACVMTVFLLVRRKGRQPRTNIGRAIGAIWESMGISMMVLFPAMGISGRLTDPHGFVAIATAMLGTANATSSMILKWKMQFACAVVWWAAAVASCFGSKTQLWGVFLVAIFFCQIVFGIYGMIMEARRRNQGATHA